jgi:hypothetical protein
MKQIAEKVDAVLKKHRTENVALNLKEFEKLAEKLDTLSNRQKPTYTLPATNTLGSPINVHRNK